MNNNIIQNNYPNLWKKCCNMLGTLIKFYQRNNWNWNWDGLSRDPNITMDITPPPRITLKLHYWPVQ
jgi:hypothetical protein